MSRGGPSDQRRDHYWTDSNGIAHSRVPLTRDEAKAAAKTIFELTGRHYVRFGCRLCNEFHIRITRRRPEDLARSA